MLSKRSIAIAMMALMAAGGSVIAAENDVTGDEPLQLRMTEQERLYQPVSTEDQPRYRFTYQNQRREEQQMKQFKQQGDVQDEQLMQQERVRVRKQINNPRSGAMHTKRVSNARSGR